VERAGIVRHERAALHEHPRQPWDIGAIDEIDDRRPACNASNDVISDGAIGQRPDDHCRHAVFRQSDSEIRKGFRRPPFRRSVRRAWSDRGQRRPSIPTCSQERAASHLAQIVRGVDAGDRRAVRQPERRRQLLVVVDLMNGGRWAANRAREEKTSPVRAITPALAHACARHRERRVKGIWQQDRDVERLQRRRSAAGPDDDVVDALHEREQRRD